jgi:hypothetical protein
LPKLLLKSWSRFQKPDFAENGTCDKSEFRPIKTFACQNLAWKPWSQFLEPDKAKNETVREKDKSQF